MTSILFKRSESAYLPDISAYIRFLSYYYPDVKAYDSGNITDLDESSFDCVWRFMGMDRIRKAKYLVHDYLSLSTGSLAVVKNIVKQTLNVRPDKRVFLNDAVRKGFYFADSVPYSLRDMGIDAAFFKSPVRALSKPVYDFAYAGSLNRGSIITDILDRFTGPLLSMSILLVGEASPMLRERYKNFSNIFFVGKVAYQDVPGLLAQARYGLNIMPDIYPYNFQTATKVLEYCALGMPIVSTSYRWAQTFAKERDGIFFWLQPDLENMTVENLEKFSFRTPLVHDLEWNTVILNSHVFDFLGKPATKRKSTGLETQLNDGLIRVGAR